MLSMNPSWKPFITPSTTVSVVTPRATPSIDSSAAGEPPVRRRVRT